MESLKCNICLENKDISPLKCKECVFHSHEECLIKWFSSCNNFLCPYCKKDKSYDMYYSTKNNDKSDIISSIISMISHLGMETMMEILRDTLNVDTLNVDTLNVDTYESEEIMNPIFSQLPLEIIISEILKEGRLFSPETFIRNFNILPIQIREKWTYLPIIMEIDETMEIVAYKIIKQ